MAGKLMTWEQTLVLSSYGPRFRDIRRFLHRYLGGRGQLAKMEPFHELEETETCRFLVALLRDPEHFIKHIRKYVLKIEIFKEVLIVVQDRRCHHTEYELWLQG